MRLQTNRNGHTGAIGREGAHDHLQETRGVCGLACVLGWALGWATRLIIGPLGEQLPPAHRDVCGRVRAAGWDPGAADAALRVSHLHRRARGGRALHGQVGASKATEVRVAMFLRPNAAGGELGSPRQTHACHVPVGCVWSPRDACQAGIDPVC